MKLPNGYGSIYRLPGNRRFPWTIRITVSCQRNEAGKRSWKYQYLGYYATQEEALEKLVHLHDTVNSTVISYQPSFEQVFTLWSLETYPRISASNIRGYNSAFKACNAIHTLPFNSIDRHTLQSILDTTKKNYPMLKKMKILFSSLYKYAIQNDISQKDYSRYLNIQQYQNKNPNQIQRTIFTDNELDILWKYSFLKESQIILILIYTGCRISELLELKKADIDFSNKLIHIKKSKTLSGIRVIPIADKIFPFVETLCTNSHGDYLISDNNHDHYTYQHYYKYHWKVFFSEIDLSNHKPHDTRHTLVSLLVKEKVDEKIIKRIVGHSGTGITEKVYTHFDLDQLRFAINQI